MRCSTNEENRLRGGGLPSRGFGEEDSERERENIRRTLDKCSILDLVEERTEVAQLGLGVRGRAGTRGRKAVRGGGERSHGGPDELGHLDEGIETLKRPPLCLERARTEDTPFLSDWTRLPSEWAFDVPFA